MVALRTVVVALALSTTTAFVPASVSTHSAVVAQETKAVGLSP
jgi:hypothetical protein